jgi:dTDP-4-amino-4,6-dideoxygalactose transaminase
MDAVMAIAQKYGLFVVEDAAHAIESNHHSVLYGTRWLGSIGHLAAFSFHETKNIISGEGGMLVINERSLVDRAEIIWEKGTNRSAFFRGETDKYTWVDIGSSFLPSEINAAFLWAQLEHLDQIQEMRRRVWDSYFKALHAWSGRWGIELPRIPAYGVNNAHMFYLVCQSDAQRVALSKALKEKEIQAVFHYLGLHSSPFAKAQFKVQALPHCERFAACLLRLPMYPEMPIDRVLDALLSIQYL